VAATGETDAMTSLKDQLNADLTTAMKARDTVTVATLRMALTAVANSERAGSEVKELSDDDVLAVLRSEAKKRSESAEVYAQAGRQELADTETAELAVLNRYLPAAATAEEVEAAVAEEIARLGVTDMKGMGQVIKAVRERLPGADGGTVSTAVKAALSS
jgi:uncharacterized protein